MHSQHALIVDDSKTAQLRLKRMLQVYELQIDVVSSAEEALAYLSYRSPAVIFLDKSMQGMDGMEALRTIKANPATATIPVIMYTSEHGSVFTSQARALGAIDILNKDTLAPTSLDNMLQQLKIVRRKKAVSDRQDVPTSPPVKPEPSTSSEVIAKHVLEQVQGQIARLFEIHIADVSRQINKSTQFLVKRLQSQLESSASSDKTKPQPVEVLIGDVPLDVINKEVTAERRRIAVVSNGLLAVVFVALVFTGILMLSFLSRLGDMQENYNKAITLAESSSQRINDLNQIVAYSSNGEINNDVDKTISLEVLSVLNWLANTDFGFGLEEEPLGINTVVRLSELVTRLEDIGYSGLVHVDINLGNICMTESATGVMQPAPNNTSTFDCILSADEARALSVENYITVPFSNLEQSSPALRNGNIMLSVNSVGYDNPRQPYPYIGNDTTAAEWNQIAGKNNYLTVTLESFD